MPLMINGYLSGSIRFFKRRRNFAFVNILGLTIGFTSFLLILFFVNHELSFDQFHVNKDQVFRVNFSYRDNAGNVTTLVNSPPALATGIAGRFPELEKVSRMRYTMKCLLSNGPIRFYEDHGYYADSLFLEILQFELVSGDPGTALDRPNSIVITEALALKYFNGVDVVGSTLMLNNTTALEVTGVLSAIPTNSHLNFDFLISFSTYGVPEGYLSDSTSMSWLGFLTYVELTPGASAALFEEKLTRYIRDLTPKGSHPMVPIVQGLPDIYLGSRGMADDMASHIRSGDRLSVNALMVVAMMIVTIAGFNFWNLNNALAFSRSKSVGMRKVLGAGRKDIITQLLAESVTLTFLCLLFSVAVFFFLFPIVANFMGWDFDLGIKGMVKVAPVLITTGIVIGVIAGFYPAARLANLDVVKSLRGTLKAKSSPFQAGNFLLLLQFAISIGLISGCITMAQQINYLQNKDPGYSSESVILVEMLPEDLSHYFDVYKEQLVRHSSVVSASRSERVVGTPWPWSVIRRVDEGAEMSKRVFFNQVDYDYFKTMGIRLSRGRAFSREHVSDPTHSIIINQRAVELLGLNGDPVGQQVHCFTLEGPRTIVGVAEDFHYTSLHQEIGPTVFLLPMIDLEYMYVRFVPGDVRAHVGILEDSWQRVSPRVPLEWRFLSDDLNNLYQSEEKLLYLLQAFSLLAIMLACFGLYGIVTIMVSNRVKEAGVRKVLGASGGSLYLLFVRGYIYKALFALLIIFPVASYLSDVWVNRFAYPISINWLVYPFATLLLVVVILLTITSEILKAIRVSPTTLLRSE